MAEEKLPRVVIVGAGFGGLEAAKKLACEKIQLIVIDRTNYHLFQPLLYQVATAALSPADIAAPVRAILHKCKNVE
ncbi:MAG: FAD-dependent oxidoreductase, partial [Verrucomicrobia bacterium]